MFKHLYDYFLRINDENWNCLVKRNGHSLGFQHIQENCPSKKNGSNIHYNWQYMRLFIAVQILLVCIAFSFCLKN